MLSELCELLRAFPQLFDLLDGVIDLFDFQQVEGRKLQLGNIKDKFTMFAPSNPSVQRFKNLPVNDLYDPAKIDGLDGEFAEKLQTALMPVTAGEVSLTPDGRETLSGPFLETHIAIPDQVIDDGTCGALFRDLNGEFSRTECRQRQRQRQLQTTNLLQKFQLGPGNTLQYLPEFIELNDVVSNGIGHVLEGYLLPSEFKIPLDVLMKWARTFGTLTLEPSESPTSSEEPSENPTGSEEPSENPTGSEEPSENPTDALEPSENPTVSKEPSENPTSTE